MENTKPQATCRALLREKGVLLREKFTFYSVKMETCHTDSSSHLGVVLQWRGLLLDLFQEMRWLPFHRKAK